jgi:hypothetical protein
MEKISEENNYFGLSNICQNLLSVNNLSPTFFINYVQKASQTLSVSD